MMQVELSALSDLVDNLMRTLLWSLLVLLGAVGFCFGCAQPACLTWARWFDRPGVLGRVRAEVSLRRDAARGLAQTKRILQTAAPSATSDRRPTARSRTECLSDQGRRCRRAWPAV